MESSAGSADGDEELETRAKKHLKRRGIFPKLSTNIMRTWLFQHLAVRIRAPADHSSLFTHADRRGVDISFAVCVFVCLFVCTVTDFFAEGRILHGASTASWVGWRECALARYFAM